MVSTMTVVRSLLLVFILHLCICNVSSVEREKKFFELTKKTIEKQKDYLNRWNLLIKDGEIVKGRLETKSGERSLYKFTGEKMKKMKLSEIFTMLQNWHFIAGKDFKHNYFEVNIGGENFQFRLQKGFFSNGQIFVYGINGDRYPYSIFEALDNNKEAKERASQILQSLDEPVGEQTAWKEADSKIKDKMRKMMVLTQVAESARPTDESFKQVENIVAEVTEFELTELTTRWDDIVTNFINKEKKGAAPNKRESVYNELRKSFMEQREQLLEAARNILAENAPDSQKKFLDLLPSYLSEQSKNELLSEAKKESKTANEKAVEKFEEEIHGYKPKRGRVPGSEVVMQNLLRKLASGDSKIRSFKKVFDKFVLTKKGGTKLGKLMWYPSIDEQSSNFEKFSEERPHKRRKLEPKAVAAGDGKKSAIEDAIKKNLNCGKKRRKRQSSCSFHRLEVVEDSLRLERNTLTFETFDGDGNRRTHEVSLDADRVSLSEYTDEHLANLKEAGLIENTGKAIGVYGGVVNTLASINYFSKGEYGEGAFSAFQAAHGIGGLTGINDVVSKVSKQTLKKLTTAAAEKALSREVLDRIASSASHAIGESTGKVLGRIASGVSGVGLALDIYFIANDIKELLDKDDPLPDALKVAHLVLDVDLTMLSLVDTVVPELTPLVEPIVIALTIVRLSIDDYYLDIEEELSKVKGRGFVAHLEAFLKGFEEGTADFLTLGLDRQLRHLQQQRSEDRELLRNISNPVNYFNVTFQGMDADGNEVGTVDFAAGTYSQYGGFLTVKLNENGSFTLHLPQVSSEGAPTQVTRNFSFNHPVSDIVLGIGQVANPVYRREEAKLWLLFTVRDFNVIDHFETDSSSQYGTYFGNSQDNNFYAVQASSQRRKRSVGKSAMKNRERTIYHVIPISHTKEKKSIDLKRSDNQKYRRQVESNCTRTDGFTVQLQNYHYDLYGKEGNDRFFLGPQFSRVSGGEDNDIYYIPSTGGKTVINNFARDEETDTLFIDVDYASIFCRRDGWDLVVGYCQTHAIRIRNWFSHALEEFHRHMYITTADGVVFEATNTEIDVINHYVKCAAVSIDKSKSSSGQEVTLTGDFSEVKQVRGSNYSDRIYGNEKPNILIGGSGADHLLGGNGTDTYIVESGTGITQIENFADDRQEDLLVFDVAYIDIGVERQSSHLILYDLGNRADTTAKVLNWFHQTQWQHMMFSSRDHIRFTIKLNEAGIPTKHPYIIDLGESECGVMISLEDPTCSEGISVDYEVAKEVRTVLDSPYSDYVEGNALNNLLGCSGGTDHLAGNGGKDAYVIDNTCEAAYINNHDSAEDHDLLLLKCPNSSISLLRYADHDLIVSCTLPNRVQHIHLISWFLSPHFRHLIVKTSDKISAFLPESFAELTQTRGQLLPFQVESDEDCGGEVRHVNLTAPQFLKCERFIAKTDSCSYFITGNARNNYIDPGPDNPYGYQRLSGGNGTDTYVMGHRYGLLNVIDNHAEDGQVDHLLLNVLFHKIDISLHGMDVHLRSLSSTDSLGVTIANYFTGESHQHLLVHSADGVLFKLVREFPYIETIVVDFSTSTFSQVVNATGDRSIATARLIIGSKMAENYIQGGKNTTKLVGGQRNDTILGGPEGEDLIGQDGDDSIDAGPGDDVLYGGAGDDLLLGGLGNDIFYGGMGADVINGTSGSNTVIFSGYNFTGVAVDLQIGLGWYADAKGDSYDTISNVIGSEYDDIIIGDDGDNILKGQGGDDFINPGGGDDLLHGGRGTDIYYLTDAVGHKAVNNFATDNVTDMIVLNNTLWENACYHFLGTELQININFTIRNSSEAFSRLLADRTFLMVTLPLWLENSTYQHVFFSFLDDFKTESNFPESNHQIQQAVDLIENGSIIEVLHSSLNDIQLRLDYDLSPYSQFDDLRVELVHIQPNNVTYYPLPLSLTRNYMVRREGLKAGTAQHFTMSLISCGLTVAISPLVSNSTLPGQPLNPMVTNVFFNGFTIEWTAPDNETDPSVSDYEYLVKVSSVNGRENFEFRATEDVFSVYNASQSTQYRVQVCSESNTMVHCAPPVFTMTSSTHCPNWLNLPSHLEINRTEQNPAVAFTRCQSGHYLIGNDAVPCNTRTLPQCAPITCTVPSVPNATLFSTPGGRIQPGGYVTWRCLSGYWVGFGVTEFQSVCIGRDSWYPPIRNCVLKPRCHSPTAPQHGAITPANGVDIYQCNTGYRLHGPTRKSCVQDGNGNAFWSPSNDTICIEYSCPSLLPQPNGYYRLTKHQYLSGDEVELVCHSGYYVRDDPISSGSARLLCLGESWNREQEHCKLMFSIIITEESITSVRSTVRYAIPSLRNTTVPTNAISPGFICSNLLASHSSASLLSGGVECSRNLLLGDGPNIYEGILSVSTSSGNGKVCIKSIGAATTACSTLGYAQYTTSVYHSAISVSTTLTDSPPSSTQVVPSVENCQQRISCRKSCESLPIASATDCPQSFEGQSCSVSCNRGYFLIGSSSLTCNSQGFWSEIPRCDGDQWKFDIERETRSSRSNDDLSRYLYNYLATRYPGVYWVVTVYDDVGGYDKHTVQGSYYHLFRHYGHNIVVGRLLHQNSPSSNLRNIFSRAYSRRDQCVPSWWGSEVCTFDARLTLQATWNALLTEGLNPVMLHIIADDIGRSTTYSSDPQYIIAQDVSGGFAVLITN